MERPEPCDSSPSRDRINAGRPYFSTTLVAVMPMTPRMPSVAFDDYAVGLAQRGLCFYALLDVFQDAAFFVLAVGV